jgi:CRISPR-associated protein Csb2
MLALVNSLCAPTLSKIQRSRPSGQAQGIALEFPEPVRGPLLLGANSHFGLGRFKPVDG